MKVRDPDELNMYAAAFARQVAPRADRATVVALSGDLGAGKTTFVQAVAKTLGIEENATSPTFVIQKTYRLPAEVRPPSFRRLVHIDAYRLENARELEILGFEELLRDPQNLILIEWPEKVAGLIPKDAVNIRFDIAGDGRTISIDGEE